MQKWNIKPDPDFNRFLKVLKREGEPDRVPFYELFSNIEAEVLDRLGKLPDPAGMESWDYALKRNITYAYEVGYDYVDVAGGVAFPKEERPSTETNEGQRTYVKGDSHTIANREDFEKYPWPNVDEIKYWKLDRFKEWLPDGMMGIARTGGILEEVMFLLGYEGISLLLYDDPQLVEDMFEAVATRIIQNLETCASHEKVGAIVLGDDMGFKTQTMLSPEMMRKYVFPWQTRLCEAVHRHGKPVFVHTCGNLEEVMDDVIGCGWDAKHSYEDVIMPVWDFKAKYGDRIAVLGGFDMDKISRMTEDEVRKHTRMLIEKCAPGGGWALGTGNTVANYVPVENFMAMIEEGFMAGKY